MSSLDRPIYVPRTKRQQQQQQQHVEGVSTERRHERSTTATGRRPQRQQQQPPLSFEQVADDALVPFVRGANDNVTEQDKAGDNDTNQHPRHVKNNNHRKSWRPPTASQLDMDAGDGVGAAELAKRGKSGIMIVRRDDNDKDDIQQRKQQKQMHRIMVEDFMDEQDHNEWGGPVHVKEEYDYHGKQGKMAADADLPTVENAGLWDQAMSVVVAKVRAPSVTVGHRLLRQMGWKGDGSEIAYAKIDDGDEIKNSTLNTNEDRSRNQNSVRLGSKDDGRDLGVDEQEARFLAERNLKRVRVTNRRAVAIPEPKLDTNGLGYSPYVNAPEFEAFHKLRKRRREQQVGSSRGDVRRSNVYRISDAVGDDPAVIRGHDQESTPSRLEQRQRQHRGGGGGGDGGTDGTIHDGSMILYPDSVEEFVGSKSVSGFALHDDDDDVYDDHHDGGARFAGDRRTLLSSLASGQTATNSTALTVFSPVGAGSISNSNAKQEGNNNKKKASLRNVVDNETYDVVAYEHHDSDPDDGPASLFGDVTTTKASKKTLGTMQSNAAATRRSKLGNALSTWAAAAAASAVNDEGGSERDGIAGPLGVTTSDGRPLLPGFVLGCSGTSSNVTPRFRGPDVPEWYEVAFHVFRDDEHPAGQTAWTRRAHGERRRKGIGEGLSDVTRTADLFHRPASLPEPGTTLVATAPFHKTNAFAGIAASMKNRFVSSSVKDDKLPPPPPPPAGPTSSDICRLPESVEPRNGKTAEGHRTTTTSPVINLAVKRTVSLFLPHPLVCKRFRVTYEAKQSVGTTGTFVAGGAAGTDHRTKEEAYFHDEILKRAFDAAKKEKVETESSTTSSSTKGQLPGAEGALPPPRGDDGASNKIHDLYKQQARQILRDLLSDTEFRSLSTDNDEVHRPSIAVYKSIYEPEVGGDTRSVPPMEDVGAQQRHDDLAEPSNDAQSNKQIPAEAQLYPAPKGESDMKEGSLVPARQANVAQLPALGRLPPRTDESQMDGPINTQANPREQRNAGRSSRARSPKRSEKNDTEYGDEDDSADSSVSSETDRRKKSSKGKKKKRRDHYDEDRSRARKKERKKAKKKKSHKSER